MRTRLCRAFVNGFETIEPETVDARLLDSGDVPYCAVYCIEGRAFCCVANDGALFSPDAEAQQN